MGAIMIDVGAADFTLGVVGAGAMGAGITHVALTGGLTVRLTDANAAQLDKARASLFARLDRFVEKGEAAPDRVAAAKSRLVLASDVAALAPCRVVLEAIYENLEAKRQVFRALEAVVAKDAILASNTSSIPIAAIAQACKQRRRVAGMHFFNPVPLMRLVEIIAAADTDVAARRSVSAWDGRRSRSRTRPASSSISAAAPITRRRCTSSRKCCHRRRHRRGDARVLRLSHGALRAARSDRHGRQLSRQRDRA
jgi:3-hydroxyacyl-CoA dehydrogenase, NAD binding domain